MGAIGWLESYLFACPHCGRGGGEYRGGAGPLGEAPIYAHQSCVELAKSKPQDLASCPGGPRPAPARRPEVRR